MENSQWHFIPTLFLYHSLQSFPSIHFISEAFMGFFQQDIEPRTQVEWIFIAQQENQWQWLLHSFTIPFELGWVESSFPHHHFYKIKYGIVRSKKKK